MPCESVPYNPGSPGIRRFELLGGLSVACGLQGQILLLQTYREDSARRGRLTVGTRLSAGAGTTVLHREFAFDDRLAPPILGRRPAATGLPCRTGGALVLPIHHKLLGGEAGALPRLPMIILSGRPEQINAMLYGLPTSSPRCSHNIVT